MQPQTITAEVVHQDFYGAETRLMEMADNMMKKDLSVIENKSKRASSLGFGNSKPSAEFNAAKAKKERSPKVIAAIAYFRHNYPQNKFITVEEVSDLCEKYNLIHGASSNFIGDIPEKNLAEIENFKLRMEDHPDVNEMSLEDLWRFQSQGLQIRFGDMVGDDRSRLSDLLNDINFDSRMRDRQRRESIERIENKMMVQFYRYPRASMPIPTSAVMGIDSYGNPTGGKKKAAKPAFTIVAPEKDFNTEGHHVINRELVKDAPVRQFIIDDDPIVLQAVEFNGIKGHLIISAWGMEAKDELVVDENKN